MRLEFPYKIAMSVNKMYYNARNGKVLRPEARNLRARVINDVINQIRDEKVCKFRKIILKVEYLENWYYQNGEVIKKDLDNRLKFLIDSICMALGIDDKMIFKIVVEKIQHDEEEKCIVNLENGY